MVADFEEMDGLKEVVPVHDLPASMFGISGEKEFPAPPFEAKDPAGVVDRTIYRQQIIYTSPAAGLNQVVERPGVYPGQLRFAGANSSPEGGGP